MWGVVVLRGFWGGGLGYRVKGFKGLGGVGLRV